MAISPPSDLVLDVAMAADPDTLRASVEKLRSIASARVAAQMQLSRDNFASMQPMGLANDTSGTGKAPEAPNPAFKKFEAFMLQSFVESMFTGDNQAVFGQGIAGDYWKSMMAEAVANKMTDAGGIGVARMLEQQSAKKAKSEAAGSEAATPGIFNDQNHFQKHDSNVILYQIERQLIHKQLKTTENVEETRQS
ncbi:flagellar biosynthesis protein FlgJ (plasmid) [Phyllobacterium zundukense]|uniref:rod-binding protein n=1 Tax=Phyllobacterium zundukense TaxID=1867719 RepID=UPI000C1C1FE7|nr:rod-binding protein [Phyllobacterium zundukense]ATU95998.1 flagellar biosynthesis protein FlgJ [Phyllobacterium zundukense]